MNVELVVFWGAFLLLAVDDFRKSREIEAGHGVVLGAAIAFALMGFFLQPLTALLGALTGILMYRAGVFHKADIGIFMGMGGIGRFIGLYPTMALLVGSAVIIFLIAVKTREPQPVTPYVFVLSLLTYVGVMFL